MENKTKVIFDYFMDYEDGKIARLKTTEEYNIPFNLFVDNADTIKIKTGECCFVDICGVGNDIEVFNSEDEYKKSDHTMASISMIPMGTFPAGSDHKNFVQSPHILFSGKVLNAEFNPCAKMDQPNYCITIETLGMNVKLYCRYEGTISTNNIIQGVEWLFGNLETGTVRK